MESGEADSLAGRLEWLRQKQHDPPWRHAELKTYLDERLTSMPVSRQYLSKLFAGTVPSPRMEVIQELAKLYGVRVTDLIERRAIDAPEGTRLVACPQGASPQDATALLQDWAALDPQAQQLVRDLARHLRARPPATPSAASDSASGDTSPTPSASAGSAPAGRSVTG